MVVIKTEIVGRETIKPSSPTPDHLKRFGLSVFDQFVLDSHTPLVLFYPAGGRSCVSDRVRRLKLSLSEALVRFYPVAGRVVKEEFYVDCDDSGVDFVEAKVNGCGLSDILGRPDDRVLKKLIPSCSVRGGAHPILLVQANVLECGGLAVGLSFGHMIMDACAMSAFVRGWAAVARGDADAPAVELDAVASRFPAIQTTLPSLGGLKVGKCETRRFVFKAAETATLRDKSGSAGGERPTRVAAISALVWKCIVNALTKKSEYETRLSVVVQPTNLRRRVEPPLSENSLGNMVVSILAESGDRNDLQGLAGQFRKGLRDLTHNDVTKLRDSEDVKTMICERAKKFITVATREDVDFYAFTSWCRFGWYEADFGWGRPAWISAVNLNVKNAVVMTDTRDGDGIEVLATLPEEDMIFFETDPELLQFGSLNPSVPLGRRMGLQ